jgi:CheY-like chemotaxis protein
MWLREDGFNVVTAPNWLEGFERIRDQVPDAIVLDLWIPVMSGPEFLKVCRDAEPPFSVPVVAISAYHRELPAEALGAQAYLAKPFSPAVLTSAIAGMLASFAADCRRRLRRQTPDASRRLSLARRQQVAPWTAIR